MSDRELEQSLEKLNDSVVVPQTTPAISLDGDAQKYYDDEKRYLADRHREDMADRSDARSQRGRYAKWVFVLSAFG